MLHEIRIKYPEPPRKNPKIFPVFLPFAGCPKRCIYCDQVLQTGTDSSSLVKHLKTFKKNLSNFLKSQNTPVEIGFFGGTFTGIDENIAIEFLRTANFYKEKGKVLKIRCSTRPDFIDRTSLKVLRNHGLDMVELGVQSFDEKVLKFSKRDYSTKTIIEACKTIKDLGLQLGIQLMPGLPFMNNRVWIKDIHYTSRLKPDIVRFYPCVVIKNTYLEKMYVEKEYIPWTIKATKIRVARGMLRLWIHGINVIRIGLPPQREILEKIVAGPWHPAIGNMVRGYVFKNFLLSIVLLCQIKEIINIYVPQRLQGDFFGYKKENLKFFKKFFKREKVIFHKENEIKLIYKK